MKLILILLLLFLVACKSDPVTVTYVIDGDSFITSTGEEIRLSQADCPEVQHKEIPAQPYGDEAKRLAKQVLLGKSVIIVRTGKKTYGRTLADVYTSNGEDFAEILIKAGLAHITPWTKNPILIWEYKKAKNNNIGLFQSLYEYPYIYRRKHKIK